VLLVFVWNNCKNVSIEQKKAILIVVMIWQMMFLFVGNVV